MPRLGAGAVRTEIERAADELVKLTGDHGRWFKGVMYEGSSHVPLIWRGPKGSKENNGRVEEKIIENTDLTRVIHTLTEEVHEMLFRDATPAQEN